MNENPTGRWSVVRWKAPPPPQKVWYLISNKISSLNSNKTSSTNRMQPSGVNFACLCCWAEECQKKNLNHFKCYHKQLWIPAGAALVMFSFLLDSEKGLNSIAIRDNCCYVWLTGMNQIMEEEYLGSSSPKVICPSGIWISEFRYE